MRLASACVLILPGAAASQGANAAPRVTLATIGGVVFDSMAMRPLAEALVQLAEVPRTGGVGAVRSARSDSLGRYQFTEVSPGTYLLGFQHLALDSLGLRGSVHRVDVRTAAAIRLPMAVPSPKSIVTSVCGRADPKDSLAVLVGSVRDARNDAALAGSFLSVRWGELYLSRTGMRRETPIVDVYANDEGWFATCVPGGTPVLTRASHDNDVSGDVELIVPSHSVFRRDLYVGYAEMQVVGLDSVRQSGAVGEGERIVARGRAEARGLVRGTDGRPIPGVRVALLSGASETRTDERGTFRLPALPNGTHTLEARAIGFMPGQEIIDIVAFREARAEFTLIDLRAVMLDTVRVKAARQLEAAARAGFERRRRGGSGFFLDETQIDTMRPFAFRDLLRGVPGVRFVRGSQFDDIGREHIEFTFGVRSSPCTPQIYLDGNLLLDGRNDLDVIVNPITIRRLEVYHRGIALPAEFASSSQCGVLAIWTGPPAIRPAGSPPPPR